jgi:2-dehydro-3-deoxyphosphogluconate aldolase/(4S)-4-hydroxy-2-oxoglutarate aldolase
MDFDTTGGAMMPSVVEQLGLGGIVPVVVLQDENDALPLARALLEGGISTMEITFRTKAAPGSIARIAKEFRQMLPGAGTVLSVEQARRAVDAGARYIVSPGLNAGVVEYCRTQNIPVIPGVATPSEISSAIEMGLDLVKFFPAEACGGLEYLKAISAPFGGMRFIPTGGIDESNLLGYLRFPRVVACGGSWMVKADLLAGKRFDEVTRLAARAVRTMLGFQLVHLGINGADAGDEALLSHLLAVREEESPALAGTLFQGRASGRNGQLAVAANFLERAVAFFASRGIGVREETKTGRTGKTVSVDLDREIGGFAVRLVQL